MRTRGRERERGEVAFVSSSFLARDPSSFCLPFASDAKHHQTNKPDRDATLGGRLAKGNKCEERGSLDKISSPRREERQLDVEYKVSQ